MAGRSRGLSKNPESASIRKKENEKKQSEFREFIEVGEKFESDRAELDRVIEAVEMSDATDEYKENARAKYEYAVEKLKEKYDRDIKAAEETIEVEMIEQEESAREAYLEHKRVGEEVEKAKLEVADDNMSEVVEQAEQVAQEMEQIEKASAEKRKLLKEQADIQHRNIRAQRLRGRN